MSPLLLALFGLMAILVLAFYGVLLTCVHWYYDDKEKRNGYTPPRTGRY